MRKILPANPILIPNGAEKVFSGIIHDVYQWQEKLFDGREATYEMIRRADTVRTIGIVGDKLLMIHDHQPHKGKNFGFPGGRADDKLDESWLAAAQRELKEETGYSFANWRLIQVTQPEPKSERFVATYLAWDPTQSEAQLDEGGENIDLELADFQTAKEAVYKGGLLASLEPIFRNLNSIEDLKNLPEFKGQEAER